MDFGLRIASGVYVSPQVFQMWALWVFWRVPLALFHKHLPEQEFEEKRQSYLKALSRQNAVKAERH